MEQKKRDEIERILLKERERVTEALQRLDEDARDSAEGDGDLTSYPLHLADEGTDAIEKEKDLLLLSAEGRLLYEIDEALRRLYKEPERFGRCERCGREIDWNRLSLVPWTRYCIDCQTLVENGDTTT